MGKGERSDAEKEGEKEREGERPRQRTSRHNPIQAKPKKPVQGESGAGRGDRTTGLDPQEFTWMSKDKPPK